MECDNKWLSTFTAICGKWGQLIDMAEIIIDEVTLPDIYTVYTPELQEQFPFVIVRKTTSNLSGTRIYLEIYDDRLFHNGNGTLIFKDGGGLGRTWLYSADSNEWNTYGSQATTTDVLASSVKWTNTDILNEDGSVYLASDPTAPEVEPKSFMAGSWMGQVVKCYGIGI